MISTLGSKWKWVVALLVLAALLRLVNLGSVPKGLFYDEITSTYDPFLARTHVEQRSAVSTVIDLASGTYFTYGLEGPSPLFSRLSSSFFSILLVLVCFLLGDRLLGTIGGVVSGLGAALLPWSFHFGRYGVSILPAYAFYVTLAVYMLLTYFETRNDNLKYTAFLVVGLSLYTHSMAIMFDFLFFPVLLFVGLLYSGSGARKALQEVLLLCFTLVIVSMPLLATYFSGGGDQPVFVSYGTWSHVNSIWDFAAAILKRAYLHLSPDFLVLSGGNSFASSTDFNEFITGAGLFRYGAGTSVGMLGIYGFLAYLGLAGSVCCVAINGRMRMIGFVVLWWVACYAVVSGFGFYDNPNAARNIVGLPAFIIAIAWTIDFAYRALLSFNDRNVMKTDLPQWITGRVAAAGLIAIAVIPSALYVGNYFNIYSRPTSHFDSDYQMVAGFLSENNLWQYPVMVDDSRPEKWYATRELSFYSGGNADEISNGSWQEALPLVREGRTVVYVALDPNVPLETDGTLEVQLLLRVSVSGSYLNIWELDSLPKQTRTLVDDQQSSYWAPIQGTGRGHSGQLSLSDDHFVVASDAESLKMSMTRGDRDWSGIWHSFPNPEDFGDWSEISFEWHGARSNKDVIVAIECEGGTLWYKFKETFEGWREIVVPFSEMSADFSPDLHRVLALRFSVWEADRGSAYLDSVALARPMTD